MPSKSSAEFFPVDEYPAMLTEQGAAEFGRTLRKVETKKNANIALENRSGEIADAVRKLIIDLEGALAKKDIKAVFGYAHEIRGLAGSGNLAATGRIADGLCKYIDTAERLLVLVEEPVISLHIDAIMRSSSATEESKAYGERVATELGVLVARRLQPR